MKTSIKKALLTSVAAAALSVAVIPCVSARQIGGAAGLYQTTADAGCFTHGNGTVAGTCSGTARAYEVQLTTDSGGPKGVTFFGKGGITCNSNVNDPSGTAFNNTVAQTASGSTFTTHALAALSVPQPGLMWLRCDIPLNGVLSEITWTP